MSARGGSSVMASKQPLSIANRLNYFPTPPWAVRALLHEVLQRRLMLRPRPRTAWEPACGGGHCAIPLSEVFDQVYATDVHDWGHGAVRDLDFSFCGPDEAPYPIDWVISNPPFTLAEMFVKRGLAIAREGVAMLMRLSPNAQRRRELKAEHTRLTRLVLELEVKAATTPAPAAPIEDEEDDPRGRVPKMWWLEQ